MRNAHIIANTVAPAWLLYIFLFGLLSVDFTCFTIAFYFVFSELVLGLVSILSYVIAALL